MRIAMVSRRSSDRAARRESERKVDLEEKRKMEADAQRRGTPPYKSSLRGLFSIPISHCAGSRLLLARNAVTTVKPHDFFTAPEEWPALVRPIFSRRNDPRNHQESSAVL